MQDSFQCPVWKNGVRLIKKQDFKQKLRSGTQEESAFAYTYSGFNPNEETKYKLNWDTDNIAWSVDGEKRVVYKKMSSSNNWPVGPLPVRFGIWSTDATACVSQYTSLQETLLTMLKVTGPESLTGTPILALPCESPISSSKAASRADRHIPTSICNALSSFTHKVGFRGSPA